MSPAEHASSSDSLAALLDRVPEGWILVSYEGRRYGMSRTTRAKGQSVSVLARELGGTDLVSANIYTTSRGHQLHACEMPDRKVLDFLNGWTPAPTSDVAAGHPPKDSEATLESPVTSD